MFGAAIAAAIALALSAIFGDEETPAEKEKPAGEAPTGEVKAATGEAEKPPAA